MNDLDPLLQLTNIVQDVGIWFIFAWLFVKEREAHNITRERHMDDLREISGIKKPLHKIESNT